MYGGRMYAPTEEGGATTLARHPPHPRHRLAPSLPHLRVDARDLQAREQAGLVVRLHGHAAKRVLRAHRAVVGALGRGVAALGPPQRGVLVQVEQRVLLLQAEPRHLRSGEEIGRGTREGWSKNHTHKVAATRASKHALVRGLIGGQAIWRTSIAHIDWHALVRVHHVFSRCTPKLPSLSNDIFHTLSHGLRSRLTCSGCCARIFSAAQRVLVGMGSMAGV